MVSWLLICVLNLIVKILWARLFWEHKITLISSAYLCLRGKGIKYVTKKYIKPLRTEMVLGGKVVVSLFLISEVFLQLFSSASNFKHGSNGCLLGYRGCYSSISSSLAEKFHLAILSQIPPGCRPQKMIELFYSFLGYWDLCCLSPGGLCPRSPN